MSTAAALALTMLFAAAPGCALVELGDEDPAPDAATDGKSDGAASDGTVNDAQPKPDGTTPPPDSGGVDASSDTSTLADTGIDSGTSADTGTADVQPQPGCSDGIKNGNETDIDCGGSCVTKCAGGKTCAIAGDCVSATCASGSRCAHVIQVGSGGQKFVPSTLTIKAGDTVKFVWASNGHNVVGGSSCNAAGGWCSMSDTNCNNANTSNSGSVYLHTFAAAGTYPFFCGPHCGSMTGTITAQ